MSDVWRAFIYVGLTTAGAAHKTSGPARKLTTRLRRVISSRSMSSDTFTIDVLDIEEDQAAFLCTTGTAGGLNDCAFTRSFALTIIEDGMPYMSGGKGTALQLELHKLFGSDAFPMWEASFHQKHLDKFIKSAKLVERIGIIKNEAAWRHGRFELENETDYPLHRFRLVVQVTDKKWLEGLKVGSSYGTTAFDAWWEDPTRQSEAELLAIERKASKWKPPAKEKTPKDG